MNIRLIIELIVLKGQLVYLCHRLDYHWYLGHVQGADGKLGKDLELFLLILYGCLAGLVPAAYLEVIASNGGALPLLPKSVLSPNVLTYKGR